MNIYPAIRGKMGEWDYYMVQMPMKNAALEIDFAHDVEQEADKTLSSAIQRELSEGRVKNGLVDFLAKREDRFFSSLVVAAKGGNPQFYNVGLAADPQFALFADQGLDRNFGVLTFDGNQGYYALDGQHRLKAIKILMKVDEISGYDPPPIPSGFADEELSVLVLTLPEDTTDEVWMQKHRRLFSSLNRHAKPTSFVDNIIIDEDDAIAITTRRLISEHSFFYWAGPSQKESARVKCIGSTNLTDRDTYFCHLVTLYKLNTILLRTVRRSQAGWGDATDPDVNLTAFKDFISFRPSEQHLDDLYNELKVYWDGILEAFPDLNEEPFTMRNHAADTDDWDENQRPTRDSLLFWTIGQEMFGEIIRQTLDMLLPDPSNISKDDVVEALRPLSNIPWDLHESPWRYLVLVQSDRGTWRMRSEDRASTMKFCIPLLRWLTNLDSLDEEELRDLRFTWESRLYQPEPDYIEKGWNQMLALRSHNL